MSSAFLDRFSNKLCKTTVRGDFQHSDGSQEVRGGGSTVVKPRRQSLASSSRKSSSSLSRNQERKTSPPTPTAVNEKIAATMSSDNAKLAFSKKPKSGPYQPYKLADYQRSHHEVYQELGKLQPDLNDAALVAKRANQQRVKTFSTNLRHINCRLEDKSTCLATSTCASSSSSVLSAAAQAQAEIKQRVGLSKREKALAFSKTLAKLHLKASKPAPAAASTRGRLVPKGGPGSKKKPETASSVLKTLTTKHNSIQTEIDAIRREHGC